jgi:hypothetical protein
VAPLNPSSGEDEFRDTSRELGEPLGNLTPIRVIGGERDGHTGAARVG